MSSNQGVLGGIFYIDAPGMEITIANCKIRNITTSADGKGGIAYILEADSFILKNSRIDRLS